MLHVIEKRFEMSARSEKQPFSYHNDWMSIMP